VYFEVLKNDFLSITVFGRPSLDNLRVFVGVSLQNTETNLRTTIEHILHT